MPVVMGAVLAAGSGSRMGGPKAGLRIGGDRLVDLAVRALRDGGCAGPVVIVRNGLQVPDARVIVNPRPERGLRSSLQLAIEAASSVDALAVLLVDTPGITASAVAAVLGRWRPGRIAVGSYSGRRSHPIVMAPALWRQAVALAAPDEGARRFLREHDELVDDIAVPGDPADLDVPEDLPRDA